MRRTWGTILGLWLTFALWGGSVVYRTAMPTAWRSISLLVLTLGLYFIIQSRLTGPSQEEDSWK